ncbi:CerR family C-terminal domain-containing protein [Alteromonas sp. C1M14]|uniref:TetR/AcrR family transcriptional regulator n=1 Tax=Alteromonas sp. C1M14 TaxID=2841567 RepID=UPI001C0A1372|nr:CerR family C-terminal domain-containing protein [Alteromonas sp. C1M14]MBU2977775.1 CerR family C-terminal domain-containing protein [Alteromonas sp. C1M14]
MYINNILDVNKRKGRADGEETKQKILSIAGELFAQRGYHNTSAKDICERAKVNTAAINYHFNGKDGLYEQVFSAAIEHFLHWDFIDSLKSSDVSYETKLDALIRHVITNIIKKRDWHGKVWAREIVSPSPLMETVLMKEAHTRTRIIANVIAGACGKHYDPEDINTTYRLFTFMAPCLMLMIVNPDLPTPLKPLFSRPEEELVDYLKRLIHNMYS